MNERLQRPAIDLNAIVGESGKRADPLINELVTEYGITWEAAQEIVDDKISVGDLILTEYADVENPPSID